MNLKLRINSACPSFATIGNPQVVFNDKKISKKKMSCKLPNNEPLVTNEGEQE